jgi:hypothetical protein
MLNEEWQSKEEEQIVCEFETWGSRSGVAEGSGLLKCYALSLGKYSSTFRMIVVTLHSKRRELLTQRHSVTFQNTWVFPFRPKDSNKRTRNERNNNNKPTIWQREG